jgi:hypothetical protein
MAFAKTILTGLATHAILRSIFGWVLPIMKGTLLSEHTTYLSVCVSKYVNSQNLSRGEDECLKVYVFVGVITRIVSILDPSFIITILQ